MKESIGNVEMTLWFGDHRDKTVEEVPSKYLRWLAGDKFDPEGDDRKEQLKLAAETELACRDDHREHF